MLEVVLTMSSNKCMKELVLTLGGLRIFSISCVCLFRVIARSEKGGLNFNLCSFIGKKNNIQLPVTFLREL